MLELLNQAVNVELLDPKKKLTPLQLLIKDVLKIKEEHLAIVDKLLEKGTVLITLSVLRIRKK